MARIPPVPTPRPLGGAFDTFPPVPAGPRSVSFTTAQPGSGATLRALMDRRKSLAERQAANMEPGVITHPLQGVANLANIFVTGMQERNAAREEADSRDLMAKTLAGIDPTKGASPEQIATLSGIEPDLGLSFIKDAIQARREAAKADSYGPVISGPEAEKLGLDPGKDYQLNQKTGQYDQVGGGGTSVTVNPPSAEMAGKMGLANGFLDNYDAILKSAEAGEMTGLNYIPSIQFGRGNGGTMYRNLLQGTEAMIRILTGAGMSDGEARQRVTQYEPALTDDAVTLVSKIKGLRQALDNVKGGVENRGRPDPASAEPAAAASDAPAATAAPASPTQPAAAPELTPAQQAGDEPVFTRDAQGKVTGADLSRMSPAQRAAWKARHGGQQ